MNKSVLPLLAVLLALAAGAACSKKKTPAPNEVTETSASVEVIKDVHGIPHIYADSEKDAALIGGYLMARDRLFQMDFLRRKAQGRLAEVYGETLNEEKCYANDQLIRAVGFYRVSRTAAALLYQNSPALYEILSAYAAGVNAFRADAIAGRGGESLPYGFGANELNYVPEPWTVVDTLAVGKMMTWSLSSSAPFELIASLAKQVVREEFMEDLILYEPTDMSFILDGFPDKDVFINQNKSGPRAKAPSKPVVPKAPLASPSHLSGQKRIMQPAARQKELGAPPISEELIKKGIAYARVMGRMPFSHPGSNNWVVSGDLTASGRPIMSNDPHLELWSPSIWWMAHYSTKESGGDLDVAGVTFPGVPGVVLGFNRNIAWGATVARGDVSDLFGVKFSADKTKALFDDGEEALITWKEVIKVRRPGGTVQEVDAHEHTFQIVPRYGPVLPGEAKLLAPLFFQSDGVALSWTGNEPTMEIEAFLGINRAKTPLEFHDSMLKFAVGAQNFVYADKDGNIAFFAHANYPIRKALSADTPPWYILPSSGGLFDWTGQNVPTGRIPQALNPAKGFLVTANNDPVGQTADNNPLNDAYFLGPLYAPGWRAHLITTSLDELARKARLNPPTKITVEDMKNLQLDVKSRLAQYLIPHLVKAMEAARQTTIAEVAQYSADESVTRGYDTLLGWDKKSTSLSGAASLFYAWVSYFAALTFRDEIGALIYDQVVEESADIVLKPLIGYLNDRPTKKGRDYFNSISTNEREETRHEIALLALKKAWEFLKDRFASSNPDDWPWGEYMTTYFTNAFGEQLTVGPKKRGGMIDTVAVAKVTLATSDNKGGPPRNMYSNYGASMRLVVTFDQDGWPVAQFALPGGQSGRPGDPHYADLADKWVDGTYFQFPFKKSDVTAKEESRKVYPAGFPRNR